MKKITRKNLIKFLSQHSTQRNVLDIGSGSVEGNYQYKTLFPNRLTIDIDPARKPDIIGDVHSLPFEDESIEFILCTEVLEHCHDPQLAINEMYRVLKPGGQLILTTRFLFPLHDVPNDFFRYTKYGLKTMFKTWHNFKIEPETESFSALAALMQRMVFQTDLKFKYFTKGFLLIMVFIFEKMDLFVSREFGDIGKTKEDSEIFTTGYYVSAIK